MLQPVEERIMPIPIRRLTRGRCRPTPWPALMMCAALAISAPLARATDDSYSFSVLHVFKKKFDGKRYPTELNAIAIGADGRLVGTSGSDMGSRHGTAYSLAAEGGEAQLLHRFGTEPEHLYFPSGPVVPQADGSVVGAASSSGRGRDLPPRCQGQSAGSAPLRRRSWRWRLPDGSAHTGPRRLVVWPDLQGWAARQGQPLPDGTGGRV